MNRLIQFAVLSLLLSSGTLAADIVTTDCTKAAVDSAVSAAANGDRILVNGPCSVAWSSFVDLPSTKALTIVGNATGTYGANSAVGTTTGTVTLTSFGFRIQQTPTTAGQVYRITEFTCTCPIFNFQGCCLSIGGGTSHAEFRVDHNTFINTSADSTFVTFSDNNPGLFDHNSITALGAAEVLHNMATGACCTGLSDDIVIGSRNFLFVEDNTFTTSGSGYLHAIFNKYGARTVFRHNQLNNANVDAHGNVIQSCSGHGGEASTRWFEVYQNQWTNTTSVLALIRGGSGIIWGNDSNGSANVNIQITQDCTSGTWPLQGQVGRGFNSAPADFPNGTAGNYNPNYAWGNTGSVVISNGNTTFVQIGITPTDATNCSGHAGNVCDMVSVATQPGTLQRCESAADVTAGCPVSYAYTPYTYPHPLQGRPGLSPPTSLTAVIH
jgi:hypothetical protein